MIVRRLDRNYETNQAELIEVSDAEMVEVMEKAKEQGVRPLTVPDETSWIVIDDGTDDRAIYGIRRDDDIEVMKMSAEIILNQGRTN